MTSRRRATLLLLVGGIGGFLFGAFGAGGGIIMVPLLVWLLGFDQRRASATSLFAVIPTAIVGSIAYLIGGQLDLVAALLIGAGGVVGSLIGTRLLRSLPLAVLRWSFIVLLVLVAVRLLFTVPSRDAVLVLTPLSVVGLIVLGIAMGFLSGLFGIGGGVVLVPVLVGAFGVSDLIAKGTALLAMIPTSTVGTVANIRAKLVAPRDGLFIGIAAGIGTAGGSFVAFLIPPRLSVILFAVLVLVSVVQLTIRAVRDHRAESAAKSA